MTHFLSALTDAYTKAYAAVAEFLVDYSLILYIAALLFLIALMSLLSAM